MAGATTQAERQAQVLAAGYNGPLTDAAINQAYANAASPSDLASSGLQGYAPQAQGGGTVPGAATTVQQQQQASLLNSGVNSLLGAIASGNKQAFDEAVRQFNQTFGLDKDKFNESVRQFNENLGVTQAGLTGTYQGQQTQQAQLQAFNEALAQAGVTGYYTAPGTPTYTPGTYVRKSNNEVGQVQPDGTITSYSNLSPAAQAGIAPGWSNVSLIGDTQFDQAMPGRTAQVQPLFGAGVQQGTPTMAMQQQQYAQQLGAINAAAALQANPFRQAEVMGQVGQLLRGQGVAGFQAAGQATGQTDFSGLGNMQAMIDDIRSGASGQNSVNAQGVLDAIPTPNKIDSRSFLNMAPDQQNLILSGMQQKYGLDPTNSLAQIKATLPGFQAPATYGTIK